MSEYIITDKQLQTATEAYLEHELSRPITEVFISGDKLPELMRCRDCEYFDEIRVSYSEEPDFQCLADWCQGVDGDSPFVEPGGFCSWGERREA